MNVVGRSFTEGPSNIFFFFLEKIKFKKKNWKKNWFQTLRFFFYLTKPISFQFITILIVKTIKNNNNNKNRESCCNRIGLKESRITLEASWYMWRLCCWLLRWSMIHDCGVGEIQYFFSLFSEVSFVLFCFVFII